MKNLPYDGARDPRPVALMGLSERVLATHPAPAWRNLADKPPTGAQGAGQAMRVVRQRHLGTCRARCFKAAAGLT